MNKLLIAGSRTFDPLNQDNPGPLTRQELWHIFNNLSYSHDVGFDYVLQGEARGADREGRAWAEHKHKHVESFPADWNPNGEFDRQAGFKRNEIMAGIATHAIVVWDGFSGGTVDMLSRLQRHRVPYALRVVYETS